MNLVEREAAAAIAQEYENVLADNGAQAESVKIDGSPAFGTLNFDTSSIELVAGGWNENVKAVFSTLKSYWPDGNYPRPMQSTLTCVIRGHQRSYQVRELNGDKDNRAQLLIGLAGEGNTK